MELVDAITSVRQGRAEVYGYRRLPGLLKLRNDIQWQEGAQAPEGTRSDSTAESKRCRLDKA